MKDLFKILVLSFIISINSYSADSDSLFIVEQVGQEAEIYCKDYWGTLQWQDSTSGSDWSSISGGTADSLGFTIEDTSIYYRAAFTQGTCDTSYSDIITYKTMSDYSADTATTETPVVTHTIVWNDTSTCKKISDEYFGSYARVERIGTTDTIVIVYHGGPELGNWYNIYSRISYDNGETWQDEELIGDYTEYSGEYYRYCNPELLFLQNGWMLLAYAANAKPDEDDSEIHIKISKDSCKTWEDPIKYLTGRTWEPSMVQLPNGEIELFYSSEDEWYGDDNLYQDIKVIRSVDNGESWSLARRVAYYPKKRDGMAVPVVLPNNRGVAFAIECVNASESPYIIWRPMDEAWTVTTSDYDDNTYRWLVDGFSGHGGAPYMLSLPTGETVLSVHIYRGGTWNYNNYEQVMIGDEEAKNFSDTTKPWGELPENYCAINNSLFLKDDTTIVNISCRRFPDSSGGIYWIEGKIREISALDPDQLLFYLPFEDATTNEASGSSVTFAEQDGDNNITYTDGVFGDAAVFDYSPLLSENLDFNSVNSFTLACWIAIDDNTTDNTIVHQQDVTGEDAGRIHLEQFHSNSKAVFSTFTSAVRISDTNNIENETWYHVASVKDATAGTRTLYVNGVKVAETAIGNESNTGQLVIGAKKTLVSSAALNGKLDDMILTTEVLDSTAINDLMTKGAAALIQVGTAAK